MKISLRESG